MASQPGYEGDSPQDLHKKIERLRGRIGNDKWFSDLVAHCPQRHSAFRF